MVTMRNNDSFALDLSSLIIHLEYQRRRVLENPYTRERMCFCRSLIMNRYTSTLQKFLIRLSSRTLKFFDDYNYAITTDMSDLRNWFYSEIYDVLYQDPDVSNKMVLLFRTVQQDLDQKFFEIIDRRYRDIIRNYDQNDLEDFSDIISGLYTEVRSWFEIFVYNILAVQLNCENIHDTIFEDFSVIDDKLLCHQEGGRDSGICSSCPFRACRGCNVHPIVEDKGENIILVITDQLISAPGWIPNLFEVVEKYHKDPSTIRFALDFRMYDHSHKFHFTREMKGYIEQAEELFGPDKISILNFDGVEFNLYYDAVQLYVKERRKND